MSDPSAPASPGASGRTPPDRLDSWKEIAAYLKRDVTTVQRWERREGMPVHRHLHEKMGSVFAFREDLDAWARSRRLADDTAEGSNEAARSAAEDAPARDLEPETVPSAPTANRRRLLVFSLAAATAVVAVTATLWQLRRHVAAWENPLLDARFLKLTDFDGIERAATISRDGRFVAFQSDRDGRMDVWVTQVGTGQFVNLTRGAAPDVVNPAVRTLGFSPDGTLVTFWAQRPDGPGRSAIGVWAVPLLGGEPRPYLEGVAEFDWSGDGEWLAYHTPGPGDPMFVRAPGQLSEAQRIFSAPPGLHGHFLLWSPDRAFVYFVRGSLPDHTDVWRIRPAGGAPERVTRHDSTVSYPVFLDARTLLYLAADPDGSGPFIYGLDVDRRAPRRVGPGVGSFTSLAASADGRRIVATMASPKRTLWRVPVAGTLADVSAALRIPLTTGDGFFPRLGPDYLLYVSSKGAGDGIWKLKDGIATELWSAPEARVIGAPAIRRDGRRIAFSVRQDGRTILYVVNADGTDLRSVATALDLQGTPAWTPDGGSVAVASVRDGIPRVFRVPIDGSYPRPLLTEHSLDPAFSPDGGVIAFSGADVGTTFPVKTARTDATEYSSPVLTLTRGERHLSFLPHGRSLVVLRGETSHKDLWAVDLGTGREQRMTVLPPDFQVRDFDVSPDGREIVLERVQELADIVLIERPRR